MKRKLIAFLPVLVVGLALATGCEKRIATEDLSEAAPAADTQAAPKAEVTVPDENLKGEDVTAEDIQNTADARTGGQYASLNAAEDLTQKAVEKGHLYTIYFDYDKYTVRESDMDFLTKNAKWLGINPATKVRIEGHADERGETDYTLALGDKRARSIRKYLEDMGIGANRLDVVSYGEEKPAVDGHGEDAWAKNRRAEFVITAN
ncbi:Peptidoglycan-associated lipoprotein [Anaerolineae bacterium]|nr:Peptidoglycan-associated lipoprotein [Anaerolineae bacterium]